MGLVEPGSARAQILPTCQNYVVNAQWGKLTVDTRRSNDGDPIGVISWAVPIVADLYAGGRHVASSFPASDRRSPIDHAEIALLRSMGYGLRRLTRPVVLVTTVEPCMMCFAAAATAAVDVIGYVLPAFGDGVGQGVAKSHGGEVGPRLVRVGSPGFVGGVFERFVSENPDSRHADYAAGVVASLQKEDQS
ncbi:hypothetical protein [Nocardia salmonicida]|uniref:hypothetical protein n=1 Tax=Nocardia salmonicida TaxID=53431 RepID=UPI002E297F69|nr:hypothetical protein [Nocardia salmonicida]